jgi:hypothetical protein
MKRNTKKLKLVLKVTGCEIECFEITELVTTSMSCLWYKLLIVILFYFRKLYFVLVHY